MFDRRYALAWADTLGEDRTRDGGADWLLPLCTGGYRQKVAAAFRTGRMARNQRPSC